MKFNPNKNVRAGWDIAFREMAARGDDKLILGDDLLVEEWTEKFVKDYRPALERLADE